MANYIPGDSLVVFDLVPPRQYTGDEAYKKDWAGVFAGCADSPKFEISDLDITADSKLAFSHSIQHFSCTDAKGNKMRHDDARDRRLSQSQRQMAHRA